MADNPFFQFGNTSSGGILRDPRKQPAKVDPIMANVQANRKAQGYPDQKDIVQTGAPAKVRAAVASVQKNSDQVAALKRYYKDVLPYGPDNFLFRDPKNGNKWTIFNPPGIDRGDVAAQGRLAANIVGGVVGAAAGTLGGPAAPATVPLGSAAGATAGGVLYDKAIQAFTGAQDTRTAGEQVTDAGIETGLNLAIPAIGGKVIKVGRNLLRTGSQEAVDAAARQGIRAPAAVTGSKGVQMTAGALDATATSSGKMAARNEVFSADMGGRLRTVANSTLGTKAAAGESIKNAAERKVSEFRVDSRKLYDAVDALIPPKTRVGITNFSDAVDNIVGRFTMNSEWEDLLTDPLIRRIRDATDISVSKGGIDYTVLKEIRSLLGQEIGRGEGKLIGSLGTADTNALYRALTNDLEAAAQTVAGTPGLQAAKAANEYWRTGRELIDNFINPVIKEGGKARAPEKIFDTFLTTAKNTPSNLTQWSQVLTTGERDALGKFTASRLGNATAGTETALVDSASDATFSPTAFAKGYNNTFNGADRQATRDFFFPNQNTLADVQDIFTLSGGARAAGLENNSSRTAAVTGFTSAAGGLAAAAPVLMSGAATAGDVALTGGLGALAWPVMANPIARAMTSKTGERILSRPAVESALPELTRLLSPTQRATVNALAGEATQAPFRQEENAPTGYADENPFLMFGDMQQ